MPIVCSPVRSVSRLDDPAIAPAPLLGEHSLPILRDLLSYSAERIAGLTQVSAIMTTPDRTT